VSYRSLEEEVNKQTGRQPKRKCQRIRPARYRTASIGFLDGLYQPGSLDGVDVVACWRVMAPLLRSSPNEYIVMTEAVSHLHSSLPLDEPGEAETTSTTPPTTTMPPLRTIYQFGLWLLGSISLSKICTGENGTWKALLMAWERWRYEETALIRYVTLYGGDIQWMF